MNRENNFGLLRLFAAVCVIYGHMFALLGLGPHVVLGQSVSTVGVKTFFLIGGYLLTKSWCNDPNWKRYVTKRVLRIIPATLVFCIIAALVVGPFLSTLSIKEYYTNAQTWQYFSNVRMYIRYGLPGVFSNNLYPGAVNGSIWSLPVELFMQFIVPLLLFINAKVSPKKNVFVVIVAVTLAGAALFCLKTRVGPFVVYGTNIPDALILMPYYVIGSIYACIPDLKKYLKMEYALIGMGFFAFVQASGVKCEVMMYSLYAYFLFTFALTTPPVLAGWFKKNDLSLGLFLYGFFIQQILVQFLMDKAVTVNVYTLLSVILTGAVAYVTHKWVELPCINLSKKISKNM